ncbi:MAG: TIGR03067 domain-containing protein [Pirellulales bacterium]
MNVRSLIFAVALGAVSAAVAVAKDDPHAADLAKMQGDWMVVSMRASGVDVSADDAQALFRTIEGDRYKVSRYSKVIGQGTFKIDAAQSPKTIDSAPTDAQPILGIYEFDGDTLRVCNARPGQPRPKNFDAKLYTGHTLIVWEREVK